ncbi:hypothetical protein IE53DRAFT_390365 [Violaceomyces palustris]|uniref:Uncharacterized protein n=1 Tax=Violaceomyces palustris TaxID=1673888 RepID=A0ACD0NNT5_9BASI|nr:hypothetical protein IE53DRAFT_390365 [Violaceomyces palustris]
MSASNTFTPAKARSLYRSLHREIRKNVVNPQTRTERLKTALPVYLREVFSSSPSPAEAGTGRSPPPFGYKSPLSELSLKSRELEDLVTFLKGKRVHAELLERYNPTHGMTEQERVRATARRVGLDVPKEHTPSDQDQPPSDEAKAQYDEYEKVIRKRTGPLPPPEL